MESLHEAPRSGSTWLRPHGQTFRADHGKRTLIVTMSSPPGCNVRTPAARAVPDACAPVARSHSAATPSVACAQPIALRPGCFRSVRHPGDVDRRTIGTVGGANPWFRRRLRACRRPIARRATHAGAGVSDLRQLPTRLPMFDVVPSTHTPAPLARSRRAGFTLLELLVVLVIVGMLVSYVGPRYLSQIGRSEQSTARAQIEAIAKALDSYRIDVGSYPSPSAGLEALYVPPGNESRWRGPYLQKAVPLDPWGRAYIYSLSASGAEFNLKSLGKDGLVGGDGDNSDVSYR